MKPGPLPLSHVRIVDLTIALAGPAATQRLAEWGAEVIKVEPPGGEFTRKASVGNARLDGETTVYLALNRSKKSVCLDLKNPADRTRFDGLLRSADVLVHNFRPGVVERLGIAPAMVRAINPRLISATVSGYGLNGPDSGRPGQDLLLQAYAGTLFSVGASSDPPTPGPVFVADVISSHILAQGILLALIDRDRNDIVQDVEVSMLGAMLDAQAQELVTFLNCGMEPERGSERRANAYINPPYGVFETRDGWIAIAMAEPTSLAAATGSPALAEIQSWEDAAKRKDFVTRATADAMRESTTDDWIARLDAHGVWCGPVHRYRDLPNHPQIVAGGYLMSVPLPEGGTFLAPGKSLQLTGHVDLQSTAPPRLGEHNLAYLDLNEPTATTEGT
jgi:crotonobetainyl-CoA:carnitine CoA-transferase CaiB-like acyl-CoA transferase